MGHAIGNPRTAAIISIILALPIIIFYTIAVLNLEPFNGFLKHLFTEKDGPGMHMLGLVVIMGSMLLLPVAFVVNLLPIVRNTRAGNSVIVNPINLLLAVALAAEIIFLWGGLIIDQIPCFIGVPNCD